MPKSNPHLGARMAGGLPATTGRDPDFYPTPAPCTLALLAGLKLFLTEDSVIWEPACGEGAISKVLEGDGLTVISTDLHDYDYGEAGINFFTAQKTPSVSWIITNPPFNLAEEFIRHAHSLHLTGGFAFILKAQYWHAARRLQLFDDCPPSFIWPMTWRMDVTGAGNPTMDVSWNVWLNGVTSTRYAPLERPVMKPSANLTLESLNLGTP